MATKKELEQQVMDLRDRVTQLEAELHLYRPREVIITMPSQLPPMPPQWWQMPVTCGYGVDSNLATSGY